MVAPLRIKFVISKLHNYLFQIDYEEFCSVCIVWMFIQYSFKFTIVNFYTWQHRNISIKWVNIC